MKTLRVAVLFLLGIAVFAVPVWWYMAADKNEKGFDESEPDLPQLSIKIDKEEYHRLRIEYFETFRGFDTAKKDSRGKALKAMERSEKALEIERAATNAPAAAAWQFLGPAPIPVGTTNAYSGRVSSIAVHPTNPDIVYVGTAQGGLYRSLNGGTTWTALMDNELSLAIGAVAISPSDPSTIFVGTGEAGLCGSGCFIGVGLYRITNADTNPVVSGPLNQGTVGGDMFTGRATGEIIVHPTDPNIVFVTTTSGIAGIGSTTAGLALPNAGVYRSTNAMSATPTFEKLAIQGTAGASRSVVDAVIEPGNPSRLIITVVGAAPSGDGGVYLTTNALDPVPNFTRTLVTGDGAQLGRAELAINNTGGTVTVYAATGTLSGTSGGTLYRSVDGGASFTATVAGGGFCNPQCFYDIAVAVDPTNANRVFLGGSPARVMSRTLDGGGTFTTNSQTAQTLHVDTQAIAPAPSNPNIVYFGSDGGMWRTNDANATPIVWTTLNNSSFSATQFMGIALHPFDRNYTLGGTQDNGTQFLAPDGTTWVRSDGGDGGFAVIDKNSPTPTSVTAYHTYFNQTNSQIGFSRALTTEPNGDPIWAGFLGCQGTTSNNGINCADSVLFYAPMVGGPGDPNSLYFGTNRLYRSTDRGTTMNDVSGVLPARVSAIGISPQNDDIRLVGLTSGAVYLSTTAGATTMTNVTGTIPARYIGRIAIDPANSNVAYVALNGYGLAAGQHVWKTTNLLAPTPVWAPAGIGIPDVPVNTFAIDPANTQVLFAGSDIGVFHSTNGGANWQPFSNGLPRVAVFGMEFQPVHRVLKIATHGRGIYEYAFSANQSAQFDYDGDGKSDLSVFRPSDNNWFLLRSTDGFTGYAWGLAGDKIAPADFDGDGKTDVAVWRPSDGKWYVIYSDDFTITESGWGLDGDVPVPGDFDGDGTDDVAVFRPSENKWYVRNSGGTFSTTEFGLAGDKPVVGDFDGDGKNDLAVYRPSDNNWYLLRTTAGFTGFQWGLPGDLIAPADYDGDGSTDVAVWRPTEGRWYWIASGDLSLNSRGWGLNGDVPVPADYDGDGKADQAVFRPSESKWYFFNSSSGISEVPFGLAGDKPTQTAFIQ